MRTRKEILEDLESYRRQRDADDLHDRCTPVEVEDLDANIRDCEAELEAVRERDRQILQRAVKEVAPGIRHVLRADGINATITAEDK